MLRRPTNRRQVPDFQRALVRELDRLAIKRGDEFIVSPPPSFEGAALARSTDPTTSKVARLNPKLSALRKRVLIAAYVIGRPVIGQELADYLNSPRDSIVPRLNEFGPGSKAIRFDPPLMRKTGRTRPHPVSKVHNEEWELTDAGRAVARSIQTPRRVKRSRRIPR